MPPDEACRRRIGALEQEMLRWVDEVWRLQQYPVAAPPRDNPSQPPDEIAAAALQESLRRLRRRWRDRELSALAADTLFNPTAWQHPYLRRAPDPSTPACGHTSDVRVGMIAVVPPQEGDAHEPVRRRLSAVLHVLVACMRQLPPPDAEERLQRRIETILTVHPLKAGEVPEGVPVPHASELWLDPRLERCLDLLLGLPLSAAGLTFVKRIVAGAYDSGPFAFPAVDYPKEPAWSYGYWIHGGELQRWLPRMMQRLYEMRLLDYETFRDALYHVPSLIEVAARRTTSALGALTHFHRNVSAELGALALEWCPQVAWEAAEDLNERNCGAVQRSPDLDGGRYLIQAARQHQRHGLGTLVYPGEHDTVERAIICMAHATDVEPRSPEERATLVTTLRQYRAETLKALLPFAQHGRRVLCEALKWEAISPLVDELARVARLDRMMESRYEADVYNSPDATLGVVNVSVVKEQFEGAGRKLCAEVLELFRESDVPAKAAIKLIEVIAGKHAAWVEKGVTKRHQPAIKAYGLLPIGRGDEEVLERYLVIREFARGSHKFGPQRQANEQGATQVALANLAQTAGYGDATRLEWAMEARLAASAASVLEQTWAIDDYEVRVQTDGLDAQVAVERAGRPIRSVPKAVRGTDAYREIKEAVAQLRGQASRFRGTFEGLMATGEALSRADLARLSQLPVAAALLSRLILIAADAAWGLYDLRADCLQSLAGESRPLAEPLRIAHSYDLFRLQQLASAQQFVVHRRIVQPFKQAFRELYLLTPAELETRTHTNRFAGRTIDPRIAQKLFQARGWRIEAGDMALPCRTFPAHQLKAVFELPDVGHYLGETDTVTTDRVFFRPDPLPAGCPDPWTPGNWTPLEAVPPIVFSEVMRDADLVVSVAGRDGGVTLSQEAYERRGQLVTALLTDLGLPGVAIDGHFARVAGKLASYRVHLGTAAIHIEPGHHLCVVPDRWGLSHPKLFLPFAGADDPKVSEVTSKVLLLGQDDQIKDPTILEQIRRHG